MQNKKEEDITDKGIISVESAKSTEDLQWVKYKGQKTGHGFSAEDANAINDKLKFKKVDKTGIDNKKMDQIEL